MNPKRILVSALVIATLLLTACGDDDKPAKKEQFSFADTTFTLTDGKIYLDDFGTYNETHVYQDYFITNEGDGVDAPYYISFELAVPIGEEIGAGKYPAFWDWDLPSETSNISYLYAEGGEDEGEFELDLLEDADGSDDLVVSGGVEEGETMTVSFKGTLSYYHFDGEDWVTENITGQIYFKGKVEDISSAPTRVKESLPGGRRSH